MEWASNLSGNSVPIIGKYQVGATTAAGVILTAATDAETGLAQPTTTTAIGAVGLAVDAATYSTTQSTDGSDIAAVTKVIINSDAVYRLKMNNGATENTALALQTVTTASSGGTAITTAAEWSSPDYDQGTVWGYAGTNAGLYRTITSTSSTAGTVIVPFHSTVVGDTFLRCPYAPGASVRIQFTAAFTQANAIIVISAGAAMTCVKLLLRDGSDDGQNTSYVFAVCGDHLFNLPT